MSNPVIHPTTEPVFGPFAVTDLVENIGKLSEKDQEFARGLLDTFNNCRAKGWELKPGSAKWLAIMAERAKNGGKSPAPAGAAVGDFVSIGKLFERFEANQSLLIFTGQDDWTMRLKLAGERSREPGSVFVSIRQGRETNYVGRLSKNGTFHPHRSVSPNAEANIVAGLKRFAAEPAEEAARYGRLTKKCCACGLTLSGRDGKSLTVGYGKTCAARMGWPYGAEAVA